MDGASSVAVVSAVLLVGLLVGQVIVLWLLARRSRVSATKAVVTGLVVAALGGALFQGLHAVEHVGQLGNWVVSPTEKPWISPWAMPAVDGLGQFGPGPTGVELLHLIGNLVFFLGVVTLVIVVKVCVASAKAARTTRLALWVQGIHVMEHVALTASAWLTGTSIGVSTFFGLVSGPPLFTYRIWWHFVINAIGTYLLAKALWQFWPTLAKSREQKAAVPGWSVVGWPERAHQDEPQVAGTASG